MKVKLIMHHQSQSRFSRITPLLLLSLLIYLFAFAAQGAVNAAEGTLQLSYEDHLLSIKAQDADIKTILLKISHETGVFVRFPKNIDKQVSIELVDTPLATALKKLLRGLNHAIIYSFLKKNQNAQVAKVYVFEKSTATSPRRYPRAGNQSQDVIARRIENYEKRIKYLNDRLAKLDANSPQAKRYTRQIESYQRTMDRLKENQP